MLTNYKFMVIAQDIYLPLALSRSIQHILSCLSVTFYVCVSIYSFCYLVPLRNVSQGDGHSRRASTSPSPNTPSLLVQSLSLYLQLFHACTSSSYLSNWSSSPPRTHNFNHMHFSHKLFTLLPLNMTKPPCM